MSAEVKSYSLVTIGDLLDVPIEKRERCVREVLCALALGELTLGDQAKAAWRGMTWNDDDSRNIDMEINGELAYTLEITPADGTKGDSR